MRITPISRTWKLGLGFAAIALLAVTVFATQNLFFQGPLIPFADPTENPNNDVALFVATLPHNVASPWHYHTGPLYIAVRQGTLTEDLGCGNVKEFPAGTALHDPPNVVHQLRNSAEMEVQMTNFQIFPHGSPISVGVSQPTCQ